jgi:hypothetical protein
VAHVDEHSGDAGHAVHPRIEEARNDPVLRLLQRSRRRREPLHQHAASPRSGVHGRLLERPRSLLRPRARGDDGRLARDGDSSNPTASATSLRRAIRRRVRR